MERGKAGKWSENHGKGNMRQIELRAFGWAVERSVGENQGAMMPLAALNCPVLLQIVLLQIFTVAFLGSFVSKLVKGMRN